METFTHTPEAVLPLPPTNDKYKTKVFTHVNQLQPGTTIILSEIVVDENLEKFTEAVKEYMRYHTNTTPYMNGLEFSNDYTQLKKQDL